MSRDFCRVPNECKLRKFFPFIVQKRKEKKKRKKNSVTCIKWNIILFLRPSSLLFSDERVINRQSWNNNQSRRSAGKPRLREERVRTRLMESPWFSRHTTAGTYACPCVVNTIWRYSTRYAGVWESVPTLSWRRQVSRRVSARACKIVAAPP